MFLTPLKSAYESLNPKWGEFADWQLPLTFTTAKQENMAVRESWGIFDVSHMGQIIIKGPQAREFLSFLTTPNIETLEKNRARYGLMLYPWGGVLDDIYIYRLEVEDHYLLTCNASNRAKVRQWVMTHAQKWEVEIDWSRWDWGFLAVQGPQSAQWVLDTFGMDVSKKNRVTILGSVIVATTGYTGEYGVEIMGPPDELKELWDQATNLGAFPCGLVARDILRTEMGYPLYGQEFHALIQPTYTPVKWAIRPSGGFVGDKGLKELTLLSGLKHLTGLTWAGENRSIIRPGTRIYQDPADLTPVGWVTSGTFSFYLNRPIALAFVEAHLLSCPFLWVQSRGHWEQVVIRSLPFVEKKR